MTVKTCDERNKLTVISAGQSFNESIIQSRPKCYGKNSHKDEEKLHFV